MSEKKDKPKNPLSSKNRKWMWEINNYEDKGIKFENVGKMLEDTYGKDKITYYCVCAEVGLENKTPHIHGFAYFKNGVYGSKLSKLFANCHVTIAYGTCADNRAYIYKNGKWEGHPKEDQRIEGMQYESGECPTETPGFRTDLQQLHDLIKQGKTNSEIYEVNAQYLKYSKSIDKIRQDIIAQKMRLQFRKLEVTYIYGDSGVGKTRGIMETYGYENVFRAWDWESRFPFDGYTTEDVLLMDEFDGSIKIKTMLNLLDGYPLQLNVKGGKAQACFTKVFIVSNDRFESLYKNERTSQSETYNALLRRIDRIIQWEKGKEKVIYERKELEKGYDFQNEKMTYYLEPMRNVEIVDTVPFGLDELDIEIVDIDF